MKGKKLIFLTLALLLPVAIFIFLKLFGRNEFNVPPMHQEGSIETPVNCNFTYTAPYHVPDSVIASLHLTKPDSLYVLYFDPALITAMNRVSVEFKWSPVNVVAPSSFSRETNVRILKECVLLMQPPASVTLIDHKNRIRGYYDGSDRDEVDRLIVEMKIILKKY